MAGVDLFVSSSNDGSFKVWDTRKNQIRVDDTDDRTTMTITDAHQYEDQGVTRREVWNALFSGRDEKHLITSGIDDGTLKLWDIKRRGGPKVLKSTKFISPIGQRTGIADSKLDRSGNRLFSACFDNTIYMHYSGNLSKPVRQYTDPALRLDSHDTRVSISPDDMFLLSSSENGDLYVWEINGSQTKANVYSGHTERSTSVAWCRTQYDQFASCSNDHTVRIWNVDYNIQSLT